MEPFFQFFGSYWWLMFPLMGAAGAAASAWEKAARRRHRRRLEILRAKSELKAAQAAAREAPRRASTPASSPEPEEAPRSELERLFAAHDAVTARWLEYELDVGKTIAYPAMSDGRQPLTAGFLRAKRVADRLRPASPKARLSAEELREYRIAVTDYEVAFDLAERDARRLKDSAFTDAERKRLDTAKQLLTVAIDQAATPAERQLAYRRVREELDGLISLSDEAVEVLEKKVALELPTGGSAARPASDAASGSAGRPASAPDPGSAPTSAPASAPASGPAGRPASAPASGSSSEPPARSTQRPSARPADADAPTPAPAPAPRAAQPRPGRPPAAGLDGTPPPGRIVRPKPLP